MKIVNVPETAIPLNPLAQGKASAAKQAADHADAKQAAKNEATAKTAAPTQEETT